MDIRQLKSFMEVAKLGSFSKAAEKLFLTQPTVTNHIQVIEREFDTVLINRMAKGVTLTEAGKIVYKNSLDLINNYDSMKFELAQYKGRIEGKLEIASSSVPRKHLLPELISSFRKIHPLVTFSVLDVDSSKVVERILDGYMDFGFVGAVYDNPGLEYIPIMDDYLVLATPPDVFKDRPGIDCLNLDEIVDLPLILREEGSGTGKILKHALEEAGFSTDRFNISASVADTESIKKMISLGTGSSFLSYRDVYETENQLSFSCNVFKVSGLDLTRKFYMVFHKKRKLSPLGEAFKDHALKNTK